jgi:hypothetical protein
MNPIKTEYFECACKDPGHILIFNYDTEHGDLWVSVHLDTMFSWYERIWVAIKYIFGYKCKEGCFGTWMMSNDEILKMQLFLIEKTVQDEKDRMARQEESEKLKNKDEEEIKDFTGDLS